MTRMDISSTRLQAELIREVTEVQMLQSIFTSLSTLEKDHANFFI